MREKSFMPVNQVFVDGLGVIAGQGGTIRIELSQFQRLPQEGKTSELEVFERLVMNVDTFLKMHQTMTQVIGQMETKGIVRKAIPPQKEADSKKQ
jgi:hypothetical protein